MKFSMHPDYEKFRQLPGPIIEQKAFLSSRMLCDLRLCPQIENDNIDALVIEASARDIEISRINQVDNNAPLLVPQFINEAVLPIGLPFLLCEELENYTTPPKVKLSRLIGDGIGRLLIERESNSGYVKN